MREPIKKARTRNTEDKKGARPEAGTWVRVGLGDGVKEWETLIGAGKASRSGSVGLRFKPLAYDASRVRMFADGEGGGGVR